MDRTLRECYSVTACAGLHGDGQKMKRSWAITWMVLALGGCATATGIVAVGPNTYLVSEMRAPVLGGGAEAQRVVLAEATAFCRQQGRVFLPLDLRPDGDPFTPYYPTAFDATFQCVPATEPALAGSGRP